MKKKVAKSFVFPEEMYDEFVETCKFTDMTQEDALLNAIGNWLYHWKYIKSCYGQSKEQDD